jgi:biotin synthase
MDRVSITRWLRETDAAALDGLWRRADAVRREFAGDAVHMRGLVEISSHCARSCAYCGLAACRRDLPRYRMTVDEVMGCAHLAARLGYGTVVLQSGEDPGLTLEWVEGLLRGIKAETGLAVTLSLGERVDRELGAWRSAGADRYLLRFETSDPLLYRRIHPPLGGRRSDRMEMLGRLRAMGYEIGSGVMIGIPGQTYETLAEDIECFRRLDLDMIGAGPFIPHPDTPLGRDPGRFRAPEHEQVPADEAMAYKVIALARIVCPDANIPATTALATLNRAAGRMLGLQRGANVVMPNLTPVQYRAGYEIYPAKACLAEPPEACHECLMRQVADIGRVAGSGAGASPRYLRRKEANACPAPSIR